MDSTFLYVTYSGILPVALVFELIFIIVHIKVSILQKHPGSLIFYQMVHLFIYNLTLVSGIPGFFSWLEGEYAFCYALGIIGVISDISNVSYIVCLNWEIYIKNRNPANTKYKHRVIYWHLISNGVGCIIAFILIFLSGFGPSVIYTCFVPDNDTGEEILIIALVFALLLMIMPTSINLSVFFRNRSIIYRVHFLYVLVFVVVVSSEIAVLLIASVSKGSANGLKAVNIVMNAGYGILLTIVRLGN